MNRRFARRILALLCAIIFAWTSSKTAHAEAGVTAAYAQAEYDQVSVSVATADTTDISAQEEALQEDSGMQPMEAYRLDAADEGLDESQIAVCDAAGGATASVVARENWASYGDDYCYNNLNKADQALYDQMERLCISYMNTQADAKKLQVNGRIVYGIGPISYENKTKEQLSSLIYIFVYQNPQYYFLQNSLYYSDKIVYLGVYEAFAKGTARSDVSAKMYNRIDTWVTEVNQKSSQYDKEKAAHDIVCDQVIYKDGTYSQSAYSAVIEGETVCAGYTKLYSILTNAAGLETVSITSATHGWNRTKLGDRWYNVDTTWDDRSSGWVYTYFNKSDATMKSYDGSSKESHTQHSYYDTVAPACEVDYMNESQVVEAQSISVSESGIVLNLDNNKTLSISVAFTPQNVTDTRCSYQSGNTSVATVDASGKVTAVGVGETDIVIRKMTNNLKTTCHVTVYAKQAVPTAPAVVLRTTSQITLAALDGCQYSLDGSHWQNSPVFSGLQAGTTYTCYVKKLGGGYYLDSDACVFTVRTAEAAPVTPVTPTPASPTPSPAPTAVSIPDVTVSYRTHVQSFGWQGVVTNGTMSGTSGKAKRLEGIEISVAGNSSLGIQYTTHCQSYGWLPWSANGEMNGTEGEAKRLEAIKIQLTGADKDKYNVYYRVHAQSFGWLAWASNGAPAGTAGLAKRLEAIQVVIVKKGESFNHTIGNIRSVRGEAYVPASNAVANPVVTGENTVNVEYRTHVQSFGWQGWKYNGTMSGTSGLAKRLEGINIRLTNKPYNGSIVYTTHVQSYGWQGDINNTNTWCRDGQMSGTSGKAKRLEAICIALTGEMAEHYDVYYRVHAQSYGWLGWSKNGAPAGTAGLAKRLEGIQIVLVPKNGAAPSVDYQGIRSIRSQAYIKR